MISIYDFCRTTTNSLGKKKNRHFFFFFCLIFPTPTKKSLPTSYRESCCNTISLIIQQTRLSSTSTIFETSNESMSSACSEVKKVFRIRKTESSQDRMNENEKWKRKFIHPTEGFCDEQLWILDFKMHTWRRVYFSWIRIKFIWIWHKFEILLYALSLQTPSKLSI